MEGETSHAVRQDLVSLLSHNNQVMNVFFHYHAFSDQQEGLGAGVHSLACRFHNRSGLAVHELISDKNSLRK